MNKALGQIDKQYNAASMQLITSLKFWHYTPGCKNVHVEMFCGLNHHYIETYTAFLHRDQEVGTTMDLILISEWSALMYIKLQRLALYVVQHNLNISYCSRIILSSLNAA